MSSKLVLSIPHIDVDVSVKEFLKSGEEIIRNSKERGAQVVVMPTPMHQLLDVLRGVKRFSTYWSSMSELINEFLDLSTKTLLYILLTPMIYRAGNRRYLVTGLIVPQGRIYYSKKVVAEGSLTSVSFSKEIELLDIGGIKICPLIGSDIFFPEIPRLCSYLGSDMILSVQIPNLMSVREDVLKSVLITRALENSIPTINLGSYMRGENVIPTVLVSSSGDIVEMYSGLEPSIFLVEVTKRSVNVNRNVIRYLKNLIKYLV